MAQGLSFKKSSNSSGRRKSGGGAAMQQRKRAPAKQEVLKRDVKTTKKVHQNIENLMAAKVLRYEGKDGGLKLSDVKEKAVTQLKVEMASKKHKSRTVEDKQIKQLQSATRRLNKASK